MAAATYVASEVYNQDENVLIINVSEDVKLSIDTTGFTVSVNAGGDVVSSLLTNNDQIEIVLSVDIIPTDTLTVAYAGGGDIISVSDDAALAIFTAEAITNSVLLDLADGDPSLVTGVVAGDTIQIMYDGEGPYSTIKTNQLRTPSILRTALINAGLALDKDKRGAWSIIQAARDSIATSIA